jgi:hypothetical protein
MAGMKTALAIFMLAAAPAQAAPLTIPTGESWIFVVKDSQPTNAHQVASSAKPVKGQIMVTVKPLMGTAMFMTNNSPVAYTFHAELIRGGKPTAARPCTLPANGRPIFEQWEQKAEAVRIGAFTAAGTEGRC